MILEWRSDENCEGCCSFHLSMDCFWAEVLSGQLELKEAEEARWLSREELLDVKWLPADLELIETIRQY